MSDAEKKTKTGLLLDDTFLGHDTGPGHPESTARYTAIAKRLKGAGIPERTRAVAPRAVLDDEITLCHTRAYLELAAREIEAGVPVLSTGDTTVCRATLDVARQAAGGVLEAVDAIIDGKVANAFCAVRPPGHHATPDCGMGFCVFNTIAIAARYAQRKHGIGRVAIIDWDVHHGNGTQDIFYEDGSVFYFSTHQSPWYPGTGRPEEAGAGKGKGATLNAPFPAGTGMPEIRDAFENRFLPAMETFKPEFVMISAGFDSRKDDPLGNFLLTDADFATLTRLMKQLAARFAGNRLLSVLEGGYNVDGLARAVEAHVDELLRES